MCIFKHSTHPATKTAVICVIHQMENDSVPNLPDVSKVSTLGIFSIIEIVEKHRFLQNLWKHLQKTCIYTFMNKSMVETTEYCSKTYFIMYQYQTDWCHSSPVCKQGQTWFSQSQKCSPSQHCQMYWTHFKRHVCCCIALLGEWLVFKRHHLKIFL